MSLEAATYINGLIATNPLGTDPQSQGDDHIRLLKSTILATLPNLTGAMTATQAELNYSVGVTSAIQTQLNDKSASSHVHAASVITALVAGGFVGADVQAQLTELDTGKEPADSTILKDADINVTVQAYDAGSASGTFPTLTALVAASVSVGQRVTTLGYASLGDGGANTYEIVAAATGTVDGGSYINLATHQAKGLFPHKIGVRQFGAVGDNTADDTAEIKNAIAYVAGLGGGELWFSLGKYKLSDTLQVSTNGVTLVGNGVTGASSSTLGITHMRATAVTLLIWDSLAPTDRPVVLFKPADTDIVGSAGGIRNLVIDGNNRADTCLELQTWFHGDFENVVTLEGVWAGLSLTSRDLSGLAPPAWNVTGPYVVGDIVTGSDLRYYFAQVAGGQAEDPVLDTNNTYWDLAAEGSVFNTFRQYQHYSPTANGMGLVFWRANAGAIGPNNNFFYQATIKTKGGVIEAVSFQESDHNAIFGIHCNGAGPVFHADDTGNSIASKGADRSYARHNAIYYCNSGNGTAKKTTAGSVNSEHNIVECAPGDGGLVRDWTIEDGARLSLNHSFGVSGGTEYGHYGVGKAPATCIAKLTANESIATGGTARIINWDAVSRELMEVWDVTNPSYFTVPEGCYTVKCSANIYWAADSAGTYRKMWLLHDVGAGFVTFEGMFEVSTAPIVGQSTSLNASTGWIACEPGDKFELRIAHDEGVNSNVLTGPRTWFQFDCK